MMKTFFVQPTVFRRREYAAVRPALACVWIETGNPRQPLACVWIDPEVEIANEGHPESEPGLQKAQLACA